eukprot:scaffold4869_cov183-Amphora_coffeaeformis.AAC.13
MTNLVGTKAVESYSNENNKVIKLSDPKHADVPPFFLAKSDPRREKPLRTVSSHDRFETVLPRKDSPLSPQDSSNSENGVTKKGTTPPYRTGLPYRPYTTCGYPQPLSYKRSQSKNMGWGFSPATVHSFPYFPTTDNNNNMGSTMPFWHTAAYGFHHEAEIVTMMMTMSSTTMYPSPYHPYMQHHPHTTSTSGTMGYVASMYSPYQYYTPALPFISTTAPHVTDDKKHKMNHNHRHHHHHPGNSGKESFESGSSCSDDASELNE